MILPAKKIEGQPDVPPPIMWVVTRERTRAGKPPMKIGAFAYEWSDTAPEGAKPSWIRGMGAKSETHLYSIYQCHESLQSAVAAMEKIIEAELSAEQAKLQSLRERMRKAKQAAKRMIA